MPHAHHWKIDSDPVDAMFHGRCKKRGCEATNSWPADPLGGWHGSGNSLGSFTSIPKMPRDVYRLADERLW